MHETVRKSITETFVYRDVKLKENEHSFVILQKFALYADMNFYGNVIGYQYVVGIDLLIRNISKLAFHGGSFLPLALHVYPLYTMVLSLVITLIRFL